MIEKLIHKRELINII